LLPASAQGNGNGYLFNQGSTSQNHARAHETGLGLGMHPVFGQEAVASSIKRLFSHQPTMMRRKSPKSYKAGWKLAKPTFPHVAREA